MDAQQPPMIVEATTKQRHDVRALEAERGGLRKALILARKRIVYYGTISERRHFNHDLAEIFPVIDAALTHAVTDADRGGGQ